jgi:hypothetical protein
MHIAFSQSFANGRIVGDDHLISVLVAYFKCVFTINSISRAMFHVGTNSGFSTPGCPAK